MTHKHTPWVSRAQAPNVERDETLAAAERDRLKAINAQLLAALEDLLSVKAGDGAHKRLAAEHFARAVIAKAKGAA